MNKITWLHLCTLLVFASASVAQPKGDIAAITAQNKQHRNMVLNREQHMFFSMAKNQLKIESEKSEQILHIDNKNFGYSQRKVAYVPGYYEITKINAATYIPIENGKFKKNTVKEFTDEGQVSGSVFYDGVRFKKFQFSGIVSGAVSELVYRYTYMEPSFLGAFYFMYDVPHAHVALTATVSDEVEIGYIFLGDSTLFTKTVTRKGNSTIYKWEANNLNALKRHSDAVNDRYFEPHVYIYVKRYKTKEGWVNLFGTTADLYKHDYKYIASINKNPIDPKLGLIVDSIVAHSKNKSEIIRGVYYYVQQNMKYIAIEDGAGGHIPREANDVFNKKYGDCKDFASLINVMLTHAKIPSYLVWIGTRDLPYTYKQLPLGYASNHMIAAVHDGNKWVFIDGTAKHIPYGVPSGFIQGKDALIAISPDSFVVEQVPIMEPNFNSSLDSVFIKIDKEAITGFGKADLRGYKRSYMAADLYYTGKDKIDDELKKYMALGSNKCEVTSVNHSGLFTNDSPLFITYQFNIPTYVREIDNELYVNLNLKKYYTTKIDTSGQRIAAKEFEFTYNNTSVVVLEVPAGYVVKKLPSRLSYTDNHFAYDFSYRLVGNKIIFNHTSSYNKLTVEPTQFDNWNKQIDAISKAYKELIVLTPTNKK